MKYVVYKIVIQSTGEIWYKVKYYTSWWKKLVKGWEEVSQVFRTPEEAEDYLLKNVDSLPRLKKLYDEHNYKIVKEVKIP